MKTLTKKDRALQALDGILTMIENEAVTHDGYVTEVVDPRRKHEVCGGRNACMIGSLYLAGGVRPRVCTCSACTREPRLAQAILPGVRSGEQERYLRRYRPDLLLAWEALNEAARRRIDRNGYELEREYEGAAESLFESYGNPYHDGDKRALKGLVRSAKKIVEAA